MTLIAAPGAEPESVHTTASPPTGPGHADHARAAIERMRLAKLALDAARAERDRAIHHMHDDDGLTAPQIARTLGVSTSLIRLTLRLPFPDQ